MQSMNRVSNVRSRNSKSTLACLANNLLLVTMFMETVSFVSTLFCLEKPKYEFEPEESKENWISPERDRRAIFFTDFADTDTIKQDSSTTYGILEENIYSALNTSTITTKAFTIQ